MEPLYHPNVVHNVGRPPSPERLYLSFQDVNFLSRENAAIFFLANPVTEQTSLQMYDLMVFVLMGNN